MREIALHLLDIAENSAAADSRNISITVHEDLFRDLLTASVADDGRGMDAATANYVQDPFYTTRMTRKVGLGIPLMRLAAEQAQGSFSLQSEPGKGTRVEALFRHSNVDRMPLGDLAGTFLTALISHPGIHWIFGYRVTDITGTSRDFVFDDKEIKTELAGLSLTEPEILTVVRAVIEEGVEALAPRMVS